MNLGRSLAIIAFLIAGVFLLFASYEVAGGFCIGAAILTSFDA
jgi:hypothetical protein